MIVIILGQADMVNMLLTRSRSINVDAKNHLGFTPLMKAALQGRIRCAKLLLFAGKSQFEALKLIIAMNEILKK